METRAGIGTDCTARRNDVGKVPTSEAGLQPREAELVFFFVSLIPRSHCFMLDYH
jgi:hypothetical protein